MLYLVNKNKLILFLGISLILIYFYFRVIYHRLPKIIFYTWDGWSFTFYVGLCIINLILAGFLHFLFSPWKDKELEANNSFINIIQKIISYIMTPFITVKEWLLEKQLFDAILYQNLRLHYFLAKISKILPYILIQIIPKIILLIALIIDISNSYMYYFYKVIPFLIIPFIYHILIMISFERVIVALTQLKELFYFIWVFDKSYDSLMNFWLEDFFIIYPDTTHDPNMTREEFIHHWHLIYKAAIMQKIYLLQKNKDIYLLVINRFIFFLFALCWWCIVFHMALNMPPLSFNFLHLLFNYSLEIIF